MNFLALCQRTAEECGISSTAPATTVNQSGEMLRVVNWVKQAYRDICAKKNNWKFLRSAFQVNAVATQEAYLPTVCTDVQMNALIGSVTVGNFARWIEDTFRIYITASGISTRQFMWEVDYDWFRNLYELRTLANAEPFRFSIRPYDLAILCGPFPDAIYTIEGNYYRAAPTLGANGGDNDVPLFPERFHESIVFKAAMYYAGYEEDGGAYSDFKAKHDAFMSDLEADQLPRIGLAPPLA